MRLNSEPLLESIGSLNQVAEKGLRQTIAFMMQRVKDRYVEEFSWIDGK